MNESNESKSKSLTRGQGDRDGTGREIGSKSGGVLLFAGLRWAPIHCGQDLGSPSGRNHIAGKKESKRVQRKEEEAVPRRR